MDQAGTLRRLVNKGARMPDTLDSGYAEPAGAGGSIRTISVTSGKGGVGKTNLVVNLGYALTKQSKRVLIFDADMGLGNINVLLGVTPKYNLYHVLSGEREMEGIMLEGPGGMKILPAASGIQDMSQLTNHQKIFLSQEFERLAVNFDVLLLDTGAGISSNVTYFCSKARDILVVAMPEPTSLTDAYALIKVTHEKHFIKRFKLVVNFARNEKEAKEVYRQLTAVIDKFLPKVALDYVGYVLRDDHIPKSVRQQKALLESYPFSKSGKCFEDIASRVFEETRPVKGEGILGGFLGSIQGKNLSAR